MFKQIALSEQDWSCKLFPGDMVFSTNPIVSCCLIVVAFQKGIAYAQHCRASSLKEELNNIFFCGEPKEVIMVSGPASEYQLDQARWLRQKDAYSKIPFMYYASKTNEFCTPVVSYSMEGCLVLHAKEKYDLVSFNLQ